MLVHTSSLWYIAAVSSLSFASILVAGWWMSGTILRGSYVLSFSHAILMLLLTSYNLLVDCGTNDYAHCFFASALNSYAQNMMLALSLGYFIVDSIVVMFVVPDYEAAFHHVTIVVGQLSAIATGTCGYALAWFLFLAEMSTPLLNCFLSGLTREGSRIDFIVRASFAFTFIVSRLLICPLITYRFVVGCVDSPLIPRLVCLCVQGISLVWGKRVILAVIDAVGPKQKMKIDTQSANRYKGE